MPAKTKNLVIVESPAKAATLSRILGNDYAIKASKGHIRDLPKYTLGVEIKNDFKPRYTVPKDKKKIIQEIKEASEKAKAVYLATDPDREGEAISWHLVEATGLDRDNLPLHRVVFHEIASEAVHEAFKKPRKIDMNLVEAQQARRILDRLVGYPLSSWLGKKVRWGLSAGRVQSAALRLVVDREREIQEFIPKEYWTIFAELSKRDEPEARFKAELIGLKGQKKLDVENERKAKAIVSELEKADYIVHSITTREAQRQPPPPFLTSTLQQEAWRKFHFSAQYTMSLAQQLYEGLPLGSAGPVGLITYMRTDSTRVSQSAINESRDYIAKRFDRAFLPAHPRLFSAKKVKGAQEAHEAIRPTSILREPEQVKPYLEKNQLKLYELIWKRMLASQMAAARYHNTSVDIEARTKKEPKEYLLRASSSVQTFPGFTILYIEGKDDSEEDRPASTLPDLKKGELLRLLGLYPDQHFTQPPPRYTEATLIKTLEERGIGRPSTYAPIISILMDREYLSKVDGYFHPQQAGLLVSDLLKEHFPKIVDLDFTAQMEENLDEIARGEKGWVSLLKEFYKEFSNSLQEATEKAPRVRLEPEKTEEKCQVCGKPMVIKNGRFGKFLACSGYPECKSTRPFIVKTGIACPECKSELVGKMNKKRRLFYGCSNYPQCSFATSHKPLALPCPHCQGLLVEIKKDWARCTKCHKRSKISLPESKENAKIALSPGQEI